MSMMP